MLDRAGPSNHPGAGLEYSSGAGKHSSERRDGRTGRRPVWTGHVVEEERHLGGSSCNGWTEAQEVICCLETNFRRRQLEAVYRNAAWRFLYPTSIVLNEASATAYVGMRQFVEGVSLVYGRGRYGVPDERYLHRVPKEVEQRIRKEHGG